MQASAHTDTPRTLSDESRREMEAVRASASLFDRERHTFLAYPADRIDFRPLPESITPEARVYRGVAWQGATAKTEAPQRKESWTINELVEMLLDTISPTVSFTHPDRGALGGYTSHGDSSSAIDDRIHMDDAEFDWTQRSEDDALVAHRWNRPDDELELLDIIAEEALDVYNVEILTAFRRAQLHRLCCWYFDTPDYSDREIVLRWHQVNGRWMPAEKMNVVEWIQSLVEGLVEDGFGQRGGDTLSGYYSAVQTLRFKMLRRAGSRKRMPTNRVLSSAEVKAVAHRAVADISSSAVALYFEL